MFTININGGVSSDLRWVILNPSLGKKPSVLKDAYGVDLDSENYISTPLPGGGVQFKVELAQSGTGVILVTSEESATFYRATIDLAPGLPYNVYLPVERVYSNPDPSDQVVYVAAFEEELKRIR